MSKAGICFAVAMPVAVVATAAVYLWSHRGAAPLYWEEGARQTYALHSRTHIRAQPGRGQAAHLQHDLAEIDATLHLRVFEVGTETVRVGFQLSGVEVRHDRRRSPAIEELLSHIFYAELGRDGEMRAFELPNTIARADRKAVINLLRSLQMVVPLDGQRTWRSEETDRLGSFAANYDASETLVKSKLEYLEVFDKSGRVDLHSSVAIKRARLSCNYGAPVVWLDHCSGEELVAITGEGERKVKISNSITFARTDERGDDLALWDPARDPRREIAVWRSSPQEQLSVAERRAIEGLRRLVGDATLPEYLTELFGDCISFDSSCVNRIHDYLRLHPEAAGEIPGLLLRSDLHPEQRAMLVNALQTAQSPQAQAALMRIVEDERIPGDSRVQAVVALGDALEPESGVVELLWREYRREHTGKGLDKKLSDNAVLSLGRVASSLAGSETGREEAEHIVAELHAELAAVDEPGRLGSVMYAAANTGHRSFVEPLTQHFEEGEPPRSRAAAARALGAMRVDGIDAQVASHLEDEGDPGVRNAIVQALNGRPVSDDTVRQVCERIRDEENDIVRGEMYRFLMKHRRRPGVRNTLQAMLAIETAMENKRIISRALASRK